jgi:hypothetical protein
MAVQPLTPSLRAQRSNPYLRTGKMDCFVATLPLRKRFAFVAGNDADSRGVMMLTVGWAKRKRAHRFFLMKMVGTARARLCPPYPHQRYEPSNLNETLSLAR